MEKRPFRYEGENMIVVKNLEKWYGNKMVLKNLSLEVKKGEVFGLLGPNGAGKTTLIKILTGQTDGKGYVRVMQVDPIKKPVKVRELVGIVPESESVPNYLTVDEYLYFVAKVRKLDTAVVDETIEKFDLEPYRDVVCRDLSKGTKQRLMFGAALMHKPRLLFLDEPFINLDPVYQQKMRQFLKEYISEGNTIFLATHILEIAKKICHRVGIIKDGRIAKVMDDLEDLEGTFLRVVGYA